MRSLLALQIPESIGGAMSGTSGVTSFHHNIPIETCETTEFPEAQCDIDTLKKLKLGMRSTLWSKPGKSDGEAQKMKASGSKKNLSKASDYSIAV